MRRMNRLFALLLFFSALASAQAQFPEYVVCCGGPALRKFEEYRVPADRHDRYWGNFTKAASIRMTQLRNQIGPNLNLTWLIYRPSYITRATEDAKSSTVQYRCDFGEIQTLAAKVGAKIVWFSSTPEFVSFMNSHSRNPMGGFEYFGHSNKYCFLFDYSAEVLGASSCYLHTKQLSMLRRGIFTPNAFVKSWGCNMADGEDSMYRAWKNVTGHAMIAADGKTDFTTIKDGVTLPTVNGRGWKQ